MNKKRKTIEAYNQNATYIASVFNKLDERTKVEEDISKAFSYIKRTNPRVVELGCGNGRDASIILNYTNDYLGMDASSGMIEIAQKQTPAAKFQIADFDNFEFPTSVDIVFALASLVHANKDTFQSILAKAHQALNPEGILLLSLKEGPYQEVTKNDEFGVRTFYLYSTKDVERLISGKFTILEKEKRLLKDQSWLVLLLRKI